ncbi:uncharacterized protein EV154DRAFT_425996 [Mucor mucedo]|uniref:uncharacterized protein n=1 Tax=Mucor mucedo TaxID=29922 RepID=UPI00221F9783|nr:uncharacterized protein EV154DRAFT_425996 [Mucor mucedo]KAI7888295.1 hypothetical protein EV154DRAFT_425996 [Mucor mucedo]
MHASTPTLSNNTYYYHHPQRSHSTEYVPAAPPPYDTQLNLHHSSPVPSPSTSWTSEMSAFAEKIKDDSTSSSAIDRHSISQGMKLVSIAADEYEQGNESVALGIYLTGIDKILMALPNKTDMNTKMAIREKLLDVEERVGIINLATSQKKQQQQQQQQQQNNQPEDYSGRNIMTNTFLLSRIASTISTISTKAYQSTLIETNNENTPTVVVTSTPNVPMDTGDAMTKFKRFGQYVIQTTVTCAVLIKRSPLPGT